MMNDVFSTFDPHNSTLFQTSPLSMWVLLLLPPLIMTSILWTNTNTNHMTSHIFHAMALNQTSQATTKNIPPLQTIFSTLFILLIPLNFLGMTPTLLPLTSHLMFTVSMGLPLWFLLIISSVSTSPRISIANLLPSSTPSWLSPPLTLIESTSILVRPLTLSVRLSANMSAGHVVLALMSSLSTSLLFSSLLVAAMIIAPQSGYTTFELGICFIQAYIFFLLLNLYSNEHPQPLPYV